MEKRVPELKEKLYRCLKVAINDEKLECQVGHIVLELAEVMKNPDYHSTTLEVWCDYFLEKNEVKGTGAHHIFLTCPRCGDRNWFKREDGWECAACGELADPEDMCSEAVDV